MHLRAAYPSREHGEAAEAIIEFVTTNYQLEAVLLVNSCARGKATRDSCLDMVVLAQPEILQSQLNSWEKEWDAFNQSNPVIQTLKTIGRYSVVHLDFTDGVFEPEERDEAAGPDSFELGVGNFLAYSVTLWQGSDYLAQLKRQWLPYYAETLQDAGADALELNVFVMPSDFAKSSEENEKVYFDVIEEVKPNDQVKEIISGIMEKVT